MPQPQPCALLNMDTDWILHMLHVGLRGTRNATCDKWYTSIEIELFGSCTVSRIDTSSYFLMG